MNHLTTGAIIGALLFSFLITTSVTAQTSKSAKERGMALFASKAYDAAIEEFIKAEAEDPDDNASVLWHGIALMASSNDLAHANEATALWNKRTWDEKSQALVYYLTGLGYWRTGYTGQVRVFFDLTESYKNTVGYRLALAARKSIDNGGDVPPIASWPALAGLLEPKPSAVAETGSAPAKKPEPAPKKAANGNGNIPVDKKTTITTEDADGTVLADRPILQCPIAQKPVKNGTRPDLKLIEKVFRCQSGEKPAAKGMDGTFIINVEAMQVGKPRLLDYLLDKGDGVPNKTIVYPIRITWTEKTFYRTRTAIVEKKIATVNFNVNTFGEWQYGSATNISNGTYKSVPKN